MFFYKSGWIANGTIHLELELTNDNLKLSKIWF